jgi:hypothetical protein
MAPCQSHSHQRDTDARSRRMFLRLAPKQQPIFRYLGRYRQVRNGLDMRDVSQPNRRLSAHMHEYAALGPQSALLWGGQPLQSPTRDESRRQDAVAKTQQLTATPTTCDIQRHCDLYYRISEYMFDEHLAHSGLSRKEKGVHVMMMRLQFCGRNFTYISRIRTTVHILTLQRFRGRYPSWEYFSCIPYL